MIALAALLDLPGLGADLERVEKALHRSVRSDDEFLTRIASHLLDAGGKRLRPALGLAVGRLATDGERVGDDVVLGGAAVELVHLGSLYHDDVMDEAESRRGVESVNARWGNLVAILAGDYLLAKASEISASLGAEVSGLLASTIGALCEGQVRELQHVFDVGRTEQAYLLAISGKTASLLSASCRIGALTAGLPRAEVDALTTYGRHVGMVFQIVDDLLDVVATDEELGKPAGNDLVEGVYTLPVIRALASGQDMGELRSLLGRPLDPRERDRARTLVKSNGAVPAARDVAMGYAEQAVRALEPLGDGPVTAALAGLGYHLVEGVPT